MPLIQLEYSHLDFRVVCAMEGQKKAFVAELIENKLIVWDPKEGSELYGMGFYGKPVGIPKPKTTEFDTPLIIDLIEGLYLLERGVIKVFFRT